MTSLLHIFLNPDSRWNPVSFPFSFVTGDFGELQYILPPMSTIVQLSSRSIPRQLDVAFSTIVHPCASTIKRNGQSTIFNLCSAVSILDDSLVRRAQKLPAEETHPGLCILHLGIRWCIWRTSLFTSHIRSCDLLHRARRSTARGILCTSIYLPSFSIRFGS